MTILIKAASIPDASLVAWLNRDVQRLHAEMEPNFFKSDADNEEVAAFFASRLAMPENHVRIANTADGAKGYVWFEVQDRSETPLTFARKRIYIHHLSVQTSARRRGIASALLRHVEEEALASGIKNIALDTWAANVSARSFFSARGFNPFSFSLGRRLS